MDFQEVELRCENKVCPHENINFYTDLNGLGSVPCLAGPALRGRVAPWGPEGGWTLGEVALELGLMGWGCLCGWQKGEGPLLEVITWQTDTVHGMQRRERVTHGPDYRVRHGEDGGDTKQ